MAPICLQCFWEMLPWAAIGGSMIDGSRL